MKTPGCERSQGRKLFVAVYCNFLDFMSFKKIHVVIYVF